MSKYSEKVERRRLLAEAEAHGTQGATALHPKSKPVNTPDRAFAFRNEVIKQLQETLRRQKEKYNATFDEYKANQENRVARLVRRVERLERINKWLWEKNKNQRQHLANLQTHLEKQAAEKGGRA